VFRHIAQPLEDQGVEVWNCTPDSALDCFPMADLRDVLKPRAEAVAS
jgi:hypothetical protein